MPWKLPLKASYKKCIPLLLLILLMIVVYLSGINQYLTFESLKYYRQSLLHMVHIHPWSAAIIFMLAYAASTALSLPAGGFFTLAAGFLFSLPLAFIYSVIAATIGAFLLFLAAKTALGSFLKPKSSPFFKKIETGLKEHTVSYLLCIRLIPIIPFWLVNLAPAFFRVPRWTYLWTTFIGIMPGTFIFTYAGMGLGSIFDTNQPFSLHLVFNTKLKIALGLLALFAVLPIFCRKLFRLFKRSKTKQDH